MERPERFIQHLFNLRDDSPPMLKPQGELRPMVHIITATLIMYYEARGGRHLGPVGRVALPGVRPSPRDVARRR